MKCLLHIGTEKTGSTVLQDWLYSNKNRLSSTGVYLSNNLGLINNRSVPAFFRNQLDDWAKLNSISTMEEKKQFFSNFKSNFVKEVDRAKQTHKLFVITSEHLHSSIRSEEEVQALYDFLKVNFDEVEVVCYFRNQFDVVVSLYSTALKAYYNDSLVSFVKKARPENYYYNYAKIGDLWSNAFGKENCNFRLYQRENFIDQDIRKDLLSVIDCDLDANIFDYNINDSNESISLLQSAAYRAVNHVIPFWREEGGRGLFNILIKKKISSLVELNVGKIESDEKKVVLERFQETNDYFFKTYFGCENLFIAESNQDSEVKSLPIEQVELIVEAVTKSVLELVVVKNNSKVENILELLQISKLSNVPILKIVGRWSRSKLAAFMLLLKKN